MIQRQKRLILILLGLFLSAFLVSCGGQKPDSGPTLLMVDSESIPSINKLLKGEGGRFVSSDPVMEGGLFHASKSKEDTAGGATGATPQLYTYLYADLPEGGHTVEAYMRGLIDAKSGFSVVNSDGSSAQPPDFSAEQGSLILNRPNLELRKNLWVTLHWAGTDLTLTASLRDATSEGAPEAGTQSSSEPLTAQEAVTFLSNLPPSVLGLTGDSMKQYQIYFTDGKAVVDGISCMRLRVYEIGTSSGTNNFLSTYLLSPDRTKLYRLDTETNAPIALPLP